MTHIRRIIGMLQVLAIALGLAATIMVVAPQPAEAKICMPKYGLCGYIGGWDPMGGCWDSLEWKCATILPVPR